MSTTKKVKLYPVVILADGLAVFNGDMDDDTVARLVKIAELFTKESIV